MGSEIHITLEDARIPNDGIDGEDLVKPLDVDADTQRIAQAALASDERAHDADSDIKFLATSSDVDIYKSYKSSRALVTSNAGVNGLSYEDSEPQATQRSSKHQISKWHRTILLLIFCLAQFLDTFNISELYTALPTISVQLNMNGGESIWLISAYQLSLASCLLIGGRISDVYRPAPVFIIGTTGLSVLSIAAGFLREKIALIVFRAFLGLCAALTIPSALALIIYFFPDPKEQAAALGGFGGCGTIGNVLGLIFGALLTEYASWPWTIWLIAIAAAPIALSAFLLIPSGVSSSTVSKELKGWEKLKKIDIGGMAVLIAALILFTFSMTSGSTVGWKSAQTLAPLFISLALIVSFFIWETKLPEGSAAIPPKVWFYPNFIILTAISLIPYALANLCFTVYTNYWQNVLGWSVLSTAVHLLPLVLTTVFSIIFVLVFLNRFILSKWFALSGLIIMLISLILFIFADSPDRYWPINFPGFILGCFGFTFVYLHINVAIFHVTPPSLAGTVGAIFNSVSQLGSAMGVAIVTSIVIDVDDTHTPGPNESWTDKYAGGAAAFEFYVAATALAALCFLIFSNNVQRKDRAKEEGNTEEAV